MFELIPFRRSAGNLLTRAEYMDRLFGNLLSDDMLAAPGFSGVAPAPFKVDIKETESSYLFEADLPGVNREAIDVEYDDEHLTISARRENQVEETTDNFVRRERRYGEFRRSFHVGAIDRELIKASLAEGVLTVEVPKPGDERPPKKIEIS